MLHLSMPSNQQRGQIFWTWNNHRTDLDILFKIMFHDIFIKVPPKNSRVNKILTSTSLEE
jgi:hypothetical protein